MTQPALDPMPAGATVLDPLKQALISKMTGYATTAGGAAVGELVAAAAPTIIAMSLTELSALATALQSKNTADALAQITSHATLAELVAQKQTLAALTQKMAQSNADAATFWTNFVYRGLTLAVSALVLL